MTFSKHQIRQQEGAKSACQGRRGPTGLSRRTGPRDEGVVAADAEDDGRAAGESSTGVGGHGRAGCVAQGHLCGAPGKITFLLSLVDDFDVLSYRACFQLYQSVSRKVKNETVSQ